MAESRPYSSSDEITGTTSAGSPDTRAGSAAGPAATMADTSAAYADEAAAALMDAPKQPQETEMTLGSQVQQTVGQAVDQTQQKAGELVAQAQQQTTSRLAAQKEQAAGSVGTIAEALRQTGQQLRERDQGALAQYADRAAQQMERLSSYLRDTDVQEIVGEAEDFARRQPALFAGGAFTLGLLAARFLKSSRQQAEAVAPSPSEQIDAAPMHAQRLDTAPSAPPTPAPPMLTEGATYRFEAGRPRPEDTGAPQPRATTRGRRRAGRSSNATE